MLDTFPVFDRQELLPAPPKQVGGRALTRLKSLDRGRRDQQVAGFVTAGTAVLLTQQQWALLTGATTTGINKALNGHRRKRALAPALTDLEALLQDVAETALNIRWRPAEVERAALEDLDQLFGRYLSKHGSTIETWRDRGGTASLLERAVRIFDRLLTTLLANNNLDGDGR